LKFYVLTASKKHENEKLTSIKLVLEPLVQVEPEKTKLPEHQNMNTDVRSGGGGSFRRGRPVLFRKPE
jgi:hypothetical protein